MSSLLAGNPLCKLGRAGSRSSTSNNRKTAPPSSHESRYARMALKEEGSSIKMRGTKEVTGLVETGNIISPNDSIYDPLS